MLHYRDEQHIHKMGAIPLCPPRRLTWGKGSPRVWRPGAAVQKLGRYVDELRPLSVQVLGAQLAATRRMAEAVSTSRCHQSCTHRMWYIYTCACILYRYKYRTQVQDVSRVMWMPLTCYGPNKL